MKCKSSFSMAGMIPAHRRSVARVPAVSYIPPMPCLNILLLQKRILWTERERNDHKQGHPVTFFEFWDPRCNARKTPGIFSSGQGRSVDENARSFCKNCFPI
jgi:hypothetical protein